MSILGFSREKAGQALFSLLGFCTKSVVNLKNESINIT
jgi:hypothetical protein